jgi:hypothetical protein
MRNPKVEVTPYLFGGSLRIAVSVDGVAQPGSDWKLEHLFSGFVTCMDLTNNSDELEAHALLRVLENGVETIKHIL